MTEKSPHTYQSGEVVPHTTTYQVAGIEVDTSANQDERAIQLLHQGEIFPNYQGRAVQWVVRQFVTGDQDQNAETRSRV